ncbi:von Hippel-Lindau-like protein isoform X2 [Triplophysa dalaica]|uniref:von Hippel-Lindau-like protein isoform X2 n=1 Tax=Triplophysa dalaica TaxID=1582913 RepID=UPI0024DF4D6B|nr:von Hippel-Lindau-like protein isoform X2 [Triplophysa dalaica]
MAEQEAPAPLKSLDSHDPTYVVFINKTNENAEAWWLNFSGIPVPYGAISPGNALQMDTYTIGEYEEDGYPLYKRVHVTAPVYSLQEYCTRMIRKMVRKEDVNKLEIAAFLKKEISRAPNLRRDLKVLAARRATNGS